MFWSWIHHRVPLAGTSKESWLLVLQCVLRGQDLLFQKGIKSNIPAYQIFDRFLCRPLFYCCQHPLDIRDCILRQECGYTLCFHCIDYFNCKECMHKRTNNTKMSQCRDSCASRSLEKRSFWTVVLVKLK